MGHVELLAGAGVHVREIEQAGGIEVDAGEAGIDLGGSGEGLEGLMDLTAPKLHVAERVLEEGFPRMFGEAFLREREGFVDAAFPEFSEDEASEGADVGGVILEEGLVALLGFAVFATGEGVVGVGGRAVIDLAVTGLLAEGDAGGRGCKEEGKAACELRHRKSQGRFDRGSGLLRSCLLLRHA